MKVFITGASGYIGKPLIVKALESKLTVIAASRKPVSGVNKWVRFDFSDLSTQELTNDFDVLIHLAACTKNTEEDNKNEVKAAIKLIDYARETDKQFVFVSSQTAAADALTSYSQTKWIIEKKVLESKGRVVRLGQVYGGQEYGLFGVLVDLVRRLPVLPSFIPFPHVQPIHVEDCAAGLLKIAKHQNLPSGIYNLASAEPVTFTFFLKSIAKHRLYLRGFTIPVPIIIVECVSKVIGEKVSAKLGLNRLSSLFKLPVMETEKHLKLIGLELRNLESGMHKSGCDRRRKLLIEGRAILTYILKSKPELALLKRYVRMIELLRNSEALTLPSIVLNKPVFLALLDGKKIQDTQLGDEFYWRLDAATLLAEATTAGSARFLNVGLASNKFVAITGIVLALSAELFWRMLRLAIPSSLLQLSKSEKTNVY